METGRNGLLPSRGSRPLRWDLGGGESTTYNLPRDPLVYEARIILKAGMTDASFKNRGIDLHHPFPKRAGTCPSGPSCGKKRNAEIGSQGHSAHIG